MAGTSLTTILSIFKLLNKVKYFESQTVSGCILFNLFTRRSAPPARHPNAAFSIRPIVSFPVYTFDNLNPNVGEDLFGRGLWRRRLRSRSGGKRRARRPQNFYRRAARYGGERKSPPRNHGRN